MIDFSSTAAHLPMYSVDSPPSLTTSGTLEGSKILLSMQHSTPLPLPLPTSPGAPQSSTINQSPKMFSPRGQAACVPATDNICVAIEPFKEVETAKPKVKRSRKGKANQDNSENEDDRSRRSVNETIGIARGRRSRLSDGTAEAARWWIFSGNPKNKPELNSMKVGDHMEWIVRQHADNIRKDDMVYIWVCGKYAGIAATAITLTDPVKVIPPSDTQYHSSKPNQHHTITVQIVKYLSQVLPKRTMYDHPLLTNMTIIRAPLATNFWVTDEEAEILTSMVDDIERGTFVVPADLSTPNRKTSSRKSSNNNNNDPIDLSDAIVCYKDPSIATGGDEIDETSTCLLPPIPTTPSPFAVKKTKTKAQLNSPPTTPLNKCTICDGTKSPMISCDSCGSHFHSNCLTDPIDKSSYAYWICFKCCMTDEDVFMEEIRKKY
eukprot:gene7565-8851_t